MSNLHAYHQNLDTSSLGITDRNNAIGTHSAHFNGKNLIAVENKENLINILNKKEFTISLWMNLDHISMYDSYLFFFGENSTGKGLHSRLATYDDGNSYQLFIGYCGDSTKCTIDTNEFVNKWTLVTFVVNGNNRKIYINGELNVSEDVTTQLTLSADGNYTFGGEYVFSQKNLQGYLDDIRLYSIVLTNEEVKSLYQTKAKIDKDSNMYTSQLVETKQENMFICGSDPTLIPDSGLSKFMSNGTFTRQDGILTYTTTSITTNQTYNGFYINNSNYGGDLANSRDKKFRYSFYIKVSLSGYYSMGEEYIGIVTKKLEAGKWYYIEKEGTASRTNHNFVFYKYFYNDQQLAVGDTISIRDIRMYRIDDDLLPIERDTDPKITKKAQIKGFELNEIDYDRLTKRQNIIEKDGAKWIEVFYHNTNNNTVWFANEAEALHCTSQYKYSRLDCLEQYRQADGKFEFLLEYPEIPDQFNRWKQTDNPATTEETWTSGATTVTPANEYEGVHIDWEEEFGGLLKSKLFSNNNQFIDGSTNYDHFWFEIGCYNTTSLQAYKNTMTGPYNQRVTEVRLYARISDEQINLGPTIINKYGAQWLEVFYHNNHSGTVLFSSKEEAMHTIGNKDKYSILDCLEQYRGKDNKFEFLLEYPTENPGQYNRWKQIDNPMETKDTTTDSYYQDLFVNGYESIHTDWKGNEWSGLLLCR